MKETARRTRSATRSQKSKRVKIFIKEEKEVEMTDSSTNQRETVAMPLSDYPVKDEEKDVDLKSQLSRLGYQRGSKH